MKPDEDVPDGRSDNELEAFDEEMDRTLQKWMAELKKDSDEIEADPATIRERRRYEAARKLLPVYQRFLNHPTIDYGLETMLGTAERKLGSSCWVRTFNRTLGSTCLKPDANGDTIASKFCSKHCYAINLQQGAPQMYWRAQKNNELTRSRNFKWILFGAIFDAAEVTGSLLVRLHSVGEFDTAKYITDWTWVAKKTRVLLPHVKYLCYTRAWRRSNLLPALRKLAAVPGFHMILSYDSETGVPPDIKHTHTAALLDENDAITQLVGQPRDVIAFRARRDRDSIPLKVVTLNGKSTRVCPHQNGVFIDVTDDDVNTYRDHAVPSCIACTRCFARR